MTDKITDAQAYLARVAFPQMDLGAGGTIIADDGRLVATLNLKDWTLTEAFAFASAFIAAGEALAPKTPDTDTPG